jgi:hypothetical protein
MFRFEPRELPEQAGALKLKFYKKFLKIVYAIFPGLGQAQLDQLAQES